MNTDPAEKITYTIAISGGMGRVGRALAHRFAREGHTVIFTYHSHSSRDARKFLKSLPSKKHYACMCDITNSVQVREGIAAAAKKRGPIHIAINAAATPIARKDTAHISPTVFRQQFEVTTFGALNFFQAVIPHMTKDGRSKIIGLTAAEIEPGVVAGNMAGYVSAKYALRGILRELAYELSASQIAVCAVAPTSVEPEDLAEAIALITPQSYEEVNDRSFSIKNIP